MVSIDMPAGPSEVLVIADKHANPAHIAADLLSQVLFFCHCAYLLPEEKMANIYLFLFPFLFSFCLFFGAHGISKIYNIYPLWHILMNHFATVEESFDGSKMPII